ncbi:hypothetical protein L1987_36164 [Smallanthus sonchifolius]|uniref:Uncharacterized protein n=1 Tax=Smallanthus sonchifolius TaxID=185202 RepID=A0ACB9HCT3_9ASTR|nr:hypothetical protein L1987_36164 [Smallanthus sonchifolius]
MILLKDWLVATLVVHGVGYACDDDLYAHVCDGHAHACDDALHGHVCDGGAYVRVLEQELVPVHSPVKLNLQLHLRLWIPSSSSSLGCHRMFEDLHHLYQPMNLLERLWQKIVWLEPPLQ